MWVDLIRIGRGRQKRKRGRYQEGKEEEKTGAVLWVTVGGRRWQDSAIRNKLFRKKRKKRRIKNGPGPTRTYPPRCHPTFKFPFEI
jgi:hypothetical protein